MLKILIFLSVGAGATFVMFLLFAACVGIKMSSKWSQIEDKNDLKKALKKSNSSDMCYGNCSRCDESDWCKFSEIKKLEMSQQ
jgi:hypothetical protein